MKKLFLLLLTAFLLAGCEQPPSPAVSVSGESSEAESEIPEDSSEEESLPEKQVLVLLYDYYITANVKSDGIFYEYTYCFDEEGRVFNAVARLIYPTAEKAETEYYQLLKAEYPNVELKGNELFFSFPKKKCPYFGITYTALPYLLEESVYIITDFNLPAEEDVSEED